MGLVRKINKAPSWVLILIICLLGFLVYANCLPNGFVWDDEEEIVNNTIVHSLKNISYIVSGGTFNTGGTGNLSGWFFRPARTLTIMINWAIFGNNAFGFHFVQVLFHLANTFLLFKILAKFLAKSNHKNLISGVLSLLFVVHAGISEAVIYIAAASEVMFTFCSLLSFYLILRSEEKTPSGLKLSIVATFLFISLLIKESAIVMIPIIFLYLWFFRVKNWKSWSAVLGFVSVLYFFLRFVIVQVPIRPLERSMISESPVLARLLTVPWIISSYLRLIFFPKYLAISQQFVVNNFSFEYFFLPLVLTLAFFSIFLFLAYTFRSRTIFWGLLWFLVGIGPLLNIFPLDMTIGERWLYFPLVGFMIAASALLDQLTKKFPQAQTIFWLLIICVPLLGARTMVRNTNWRDGLTLYGHDLKLNPESFDIQNNYGVELFRHGQIKEAKVHFEKSLSLNSKWYFAANNLGAVYSREGDWQKAASLYQASIEKGDYYLAYENLASLKLDHEPLLETIKFSEEAVAKLPQNAHLRKILAIAYWRVGEKEKAAIQAKAAFTLAPTPENQALFLAILQGEKL